MPKISFLTEQVAGRLREQILEGRWRETLPGRYPLAEELGCSHWTIDKAVEQLVKEGLLISQGSGRPKRIKMNKGKSTRRNLRVMFLLYEESDRSEGKLLQMIDKLHQCLESLFRSTPPTALIVDQSALMFTILQFLAARRLRVPEDVSLVCLEDHPMFEWSIPVVTHLHVDRSQWVKRVAQWVDRVAAGKEDQKLTLTKVTIVDGGTIGPASKTKRRIPPIV